MKIIQISVNIHYLYKLIFFFFFFLFKPTSFEHYFLMRYNSNVQIKNNNALIIDSTEVNEVKRVSDTISIYHTFRYVVVGPRVKNRTLQLGI